MLQRKDRKIGRDDNGAGEKHRALDLMDGFPDDLHYRSLVIAPADVAQNILDDDHRPVHDHPEIERSQREEIGGNMAQIKTNRGKKKRERDRQHNDNCWPHNSEEKTKNATT